MSRVIDAWILLCAVCGCAAGLPIDELRRSSVFIEGEDFTPMGPEWRVGEGWYDDIYEATSGNAVLANDGGGGEAVAHVQIPADATYHVWMRYLKIGAYPGTIALRIEQDGATVFDHKYRTAPEGGDWRPVWEKFTADLVAGPATVTLSIAQPGIRQRVDCVLITPDLDYEPNYRDFARPVYVRFRLTEPAAPAVASVTTYQHRGPVYYGYPGTISTGGLEVGEPIPPATWSPWCELSRWMDAGKWLTTVKLKFLVGGKPVQRVAGEFQVAVEPDDARAQTFHENIQGSIVTLVLPGDLVRFPDIPALASQLSARHLQMARDLNLPPLPETDGRIPLEMIICGYGDAYESMDVLGMEMQAARIFGANSFNDMIGPRRARAADLGVRRIFLNRWLPYQAWHCPTAANLPEMMDQEFSRAAAEINQEDPGALAVAYRNKLWDEPGTSDLRHLRDCASCVAAFQQYLQERGFSPSDFGRQSWDDIKPVERAEAVDAVTRKLHYWSVQFRDFTNANLVLQARLASERQLGEHILTCVNFTDGALSGWDAAMTNGPDWFLYGRMKAETLLWSEDWTALGPEVSGYIADMLRAAARPHGLPTGEYIICNHVPTLEQRTFSALMHGVRILNFYCYGPYYAFADGMVAENPETQRVLGQTLRKVAAADPYLHPAQVPPAQVAILYGKSHEIWQQDAAVNTERRTMYLAMQHSHVPVDMVCEQDIEEGILDGYRLLIMTESNLTRAAAQKVTRWVKAGGVLQMCAGAGTSDQFNEPLTDILNLCGISVEAVDKPAGDYREHYGVRYLTSSGELTLPAGELWPECTLPLVGYRETVTLEGEDPVAQVLARFSDGTPAVLQRAVGAGIVLRYCFMPGLAYVRTADPGPNRLTLGYRPELLSVLTAGVRLAGVTSPLQVSSPLVEAQLLPGPQADVVVLCNWSGGDLQDLQVTLRDATAYTAARSITLGPLTVNRVGAVGRLQMSLGASDVIVLSKSP